MISSLIIYTQFFSRIRIPKAVDISYIRRGVPYLSLFGFLVGLLSALFYFLTSLCLPGIVSWVLTLFFDILITGGFHLDALADTADGLFSSRKKERMLEIMKDSRIGSNGVLALIFFYALMIVIYPFLSETIWLVVACLSMIGKAGLSLQLYRMIYARNQDGTGNFFTGTSTFAIVLSQIFPLVVSIWGFQWRGLWAYVLVLLGAIVYRRFVYAKIDGHTGDTLGAFVEISQILYLIGLII